KPIVTAAKAPAAPAASKRPQAQVRPRTVKVATPPLPVRSVSVMRRSAPQNPNVRVPSFSVIRVAQDDVLNVRAGPSEYHQRIGALPPDCRGVRIIGSCHGLWCPIRHGRV